MARIAIITHEHPNEVIAQHQARQVGGILRKAGHEVIEYHYPLSKTLLGIVNEAKRKRPLGLAEKKRLRKEIARVVDSDVMTEEIKRETGADYAYNFHTTPEEQLFSSRREAKKGFTIESAAFDPNSAAVEIGCKYAAHPHAETNKRIFSKILGYDEAAKRLARGNEENYLMRTCPYAQNRHRLSPELSHKIAAAIIAHMRQTARG